VLAADVTGKQRGTNLQEKQAFKFYTALVQVRPTDTKPPKHTAYSAFFDLSNVFYIVSHALVFVHSPILDLP
jgi:hypothetical protein